MNTWASLDASIALESRFDFVGKLSSFSPVLAGFAVAPGVVATHRNLKSTTHRGDRVVLVMLSHEVKLHSWLREKMLMAFLVYHAPVALAPVLV